MKMNCAPFQLVSAVFECLTNIKLRHVRFALGCCTPHDVHSSIASSASAWICPASGCPHRSIGQVPLPVGRHSPSWQRIGRLFAGGRAFGFGESSGAMRRSWRRKAMMRHRQKRDAKKDY